MPEKEEGSEVAKNNGNGKAMVIGELKGKIEMMEKNQVSHEDRVERTVEKIFNKIDTLGHVVSNKISGSNGRVSAKMDEHIKEMRQKNEDQDKVITAIDKKQDGVIRTASIAGGTAGGIIGGVLGFFSKFLGGG